MDIHKQIKKLKENKNHFAFRMRRARQQDALMDADQHEASCIMIQEEIDRLEAYVSKPEVTKRNGSNYIECMHCKKMIHQTRVVKHICEVTPVSRALRKLENV
jgi:hypothetical protein